MFQKVLVPLDGSKLAEAILRYVSYLATGLNIPVVVMSAIPRDTPQRVEEKVKHYLQEIVDRLAKDGVQAESVVRFGSTAEEIIRTAESRACNLIALSTHGDNPTGRGILGSVTVKALHSSPIPILLLSPQKAAWYWEHGVTTPRIITPLDGSSSAETALPYAESLAQQLGAKVTLIRAVTLGGLHSAYLADPALGIAVDPEAAIETESTEYLARITEQLKADGLDVESRLSRGASAQSVVELSQEFPQSLIIMTTHGRSALARWIIGSVTEAVVRTAEDAVLVIPRQYGRRYAVEVTDMLEQTPLFSKLPEHDLENIAQAARIRPYRAGEVIVKEGDNANGFFVIASGKVEVIKGVDTPTSSVVATLGPGDFFGEMAIIDDHPRSATVRVVEDTECAVIRRADFLAELERHPAIAVRMLPVLVQRLREAEASLME